MAVQRPSFVARSHAMRRAIEQAHLFAQYEDVVVVLVGETGVGKSYFAVDIHLASPRAQGPFVEANFAMMDESLAGSELFGHRKGAFTGATDDRTGLCLSAHRGTLFLDEIALAPRAVQGRLLPLLDQRGIRGVGDDRRIPVDLRFVIGTNVHPDRLLSDGRLLPDLFYRFQKCYVQIPPLRERRADIPELVEQFVRAGAPRLGYREAPPAVDPELVTALQSHDWPGNVRELKDTIHRLLIEARGAPVLGLELCRCELASLAGPSAKSARAREIERVRTRLRDGAELQDVIRESGRSRSTVYNWGGDLLEARRGSPGDEARLDEVAG